MNATPCDKRYVFGVVLFQEGFVGPRKWFRRGDHFVAANSGPMGRWTPAAPRAALSYPILDRARAGHAVAVQDQADVLVIGLPASVSGRLLVCC
jgi:hypothetical protein